METDEGYLNVHCPFGHEHNGMVDVALGAVEDYFFGVRDEVHDYFDRVEKGVVSFLV